MSQVAKVVFLMDKFGPHKVQGHPFRAGIVGLATEELDTTVLSLGRGNFIHVKGGAVDTFGISGSARRTVVLHKSRGFNLNP